MKAQFFGNIVSLLITVCMSWIAGAQSNQTTSPIGGAIPSPTWQWGMATNGFCGELRVSWDDDHRRLPRIAVWVVDLAGVRAAEIAVANTNLARHEVPTWAFGETHWDMTNWRGTIIRRMRYNEWLYYMATNFFCGPIELQSSSGRKLPALKPEVCAMEGYPVAYRFGTATNNVRQSDDYHGPPIPNGLGNFHPRLASFPLGDYFEVKEPGEYTLTVWPKIYKRSASDADLCQRIDLPPVTVTIKWDEAPHK
jgi:hypothetical protein